MTCVTNYCPELDVFYAFAIAGVYLIGVGVAVAVRNYRYQKMLDKSFNPAKYQRKRRVS